MESVREGILTALDDYPDGASIDQLWAFFDNVPAKAYVSKILVQLINTGKVRAEKPPPARGSDMPRAGMNRRKKYYLVRGE
jgi:hypothetical protein